MGKMKFNQMTMTSLKCSLRLQPCRQWIFVLYFVLITIIDLNYVDGLSTTNERGMYSIWAFPFLVDPFILPTHSFFFDSRIFGVCARDLKRIPCFWFCLITSSDRANQSNEMTDFEGNLPHFCVKTIVGILNHLLHFQIVMPKAIKWKSL